VIADCRFAIADMRLPIEFGNTESWIAQSQPELATIGNLQLAISNRQSSCVTLHVFELLNPAMLV
jgi:hypothetical protein